MSGKYTSEIFKTGAELDEALQAALNAKANATIAERSAASAESAAKTAEDSAAAAVEAGRYVDGAAEGVQNAIDNIPPGETPIVNDLTTGGVTMALSAEQGKALKALLDALTAADVGAVSKAGGDTITGVIYYGDKKKFITWHNNDLGFIIANAEGDTANSTRLMVGNSVGFDLANAVWLSRWVNGAETKYPVLHSGNISTYAAPAGYGLGNLAREFSHGQDLNTCTLCGFYGTVQSSTVASLVNKPTYGFAAGEVEMLVIANRGGYLTQILHNSSTGGFGVTAQRDIRGSNVGEWEYINPPMELGVEYRTTERYNGKPVYARRVDVGAVTANTQAVWMDTACPVDAVVHSFAVGHYAPGDSVITTPFRDDGSGFKAESSAYAYNHTAMNRLVVTVNANCAFDWCHATIKYTKETD